jgi:hypothetical protein
VDLLARFLKASITLILAIYTNDFFGKDNFEDKARISENYR